MTKSHARSYGTWFSETRRSLRKARVFGSGRWPLFMAWSFKCGTKSSKRPPNQDMWCPVRRGNVGVETPFQTPLLVQSLILCQSQNLRLVKSSIVRWCLSLGALLLRHAKAGCGVISVLTGILLHTVPLPSKLTRMTRTMPLRTRFRTVRSYGTTSRWGTSLGKSLSCCGSFFARLGEAIVANSYHFFCWSNLQRRLCCATDGTFPPLHTFCRCHVTVGFLSYVPPHLSLFSRLVSRFISWMFSKTFVRQE